MLIRMVVVAIKSKLTVIAVIATVTRMMEITIIDQ